MDDDTGGIAVGALADKDLVLERVTPGQNGYDTSADGKFT